MNGLRTASEWLVSAGVCQIPFTVNGAVVGELELLVPALAWGAKVFCETRCFGRLFLCQARRKPQRWQV